MAPPQIVRRPRNQPTPAALCVCGCGQPGVILVSGQPICGHHFLDAAETLGGMRQLLQPEAFAHYVRSQLLLSRWQARIRLGSSGRAAARG